MPRDEVSRTANVGTVGTNGLKEKNRYIRKQLFFQREANETLWMSVYLRVANHIEKYPSMVELTANS